MGAPQSAPSLPGMSILPYLYSVAVAASVVSALAESPSVAAAVVVPEEDVLPQAESVKVNARAIAVRHEIFLDVFMIKIPFVLKNFAHPCCKTPCRFHNTEV
jgi:hypothetical protein